MLKTRLHEHFKPTNEDSVIRQHTNEFKHEIDPSKISVLDTEENPFDRGVKEAVYIYSKGANLNRDTGRHELSPVYFKLLQKPGEDLIQGPRQNTRTFTPEEEEDKQAPN